MTIAKWILGLMALAVSSAALAATVTVTWTLPTSNTDGSAIAATGAGSITATRVEWGTCSGAAFGTRAGDVSVTVPALSTVLTLGPGTWCIRAYATNTYNVESAPTNAVQRVVPPPTPNPPAIVTAVVAGLVDSPAFKILADGTRSSAVAGFVKVGAACTGPVVFSYRSKPYRRVSADDVRWWATTKTADVAAACA